jgi:hypothetical protein
MSTSYSSVSWCYYMTRLRCSVFKIPEAHTLKCDPIRFRHVSSLGFKWQTSFPVTFWPPSYKIQEVLGGNKCDRAPVAFSNTHTQFNVFFHRIYTNCASEHSHKPKIPVINVGSSAEREREKNCSTLPNMLVSNTAMCKWINVRFSRGPTHRDNKRNFVTRAGTVLVV